MKNKSVLSIISSVVLVLVLILTLYIVVCRLSGKIPNFFGYKTVMILTDSMDAQEDGADVDIPRGSYILIKEKDPAEIVKGDVITFYSADERISGALNTHCVVDIKTNDDGSRSFITQGVNIKTNPGPDDNPTEEKNIVGVYVGKLNVLTFIMKALANKVVLIALVVILGAIIVIPSAVGRKKEENNK